MAITPMIDMGKDFVHVNMVSESNAVGFKFNLGASPFGNPKKSYFKVNDVDIGIPPTANGLNVRVMSGVKTISDSKSFNLTPTDSAMNSGFITYMESVTQPIVVLISSGPLKCSPQIETWFKNAYSVNFPSKFLCDNFNYSYVGIYSTTRKKIIMESMMGDDRAVHDAFAVIESVCDELRDLGATGFAHRAVYDPYETTTNTDYEFNRYPIGAGLIAPMANYGIKPGASMMLSCDLYQSTEMVAAGQTTRANIRWYNGTNLVDSASVNVPNNVVDEWWSITDLYMTAPETANGFTIVVARYPRNDSVVGKAGVRNLAFAEVSRPDEKGKNAAFGVNGIQANLLIEGTVGNLILELSDSKKFDENKVSVNGLKEKELPY